MKLCVFLVILFLVSKLQGELHKIVLRLIAHWLLSPMAVHGGRR